MYRRLLPLILLLLVGILTAACTNQTSAVKLAPLSVLPEAMRNAPVSVRTAYQFAVAQPGALKHVPCYCGCGAIGHHSNLDCYVKEMGGDGKVTYDDHALGCSICVDITKDVMKMTGQGKSPAQIRSEIVDIYSAFGPANQ